MDAGVAVRHERGWPNGRQVLRSRALRHVRYDQGRNACRSSQYGGARRLNRMVVIRSATNVYQRSLDARSTTTHSRFDTISRHESGCGCLRRSTMASIDSIHGKSTPVR